MNTTADIAALRAAAGAMRDDGRTGDAARWALEAELAEAFDGYGYPLGAPHPVMVETAYTYQAAVA